MRAPAHLIMRQPKPRPKPPARKAFHRIKEAAVLGKQERGKRGARHRRQAFDIPEKFMPPRQARPLPGARSVPARVMEP